MYNINSKTKLKWIFAFVVALLVAITGYILSFSEKSASALNDLNSEWYYAESNHSAGYAYNSDFVTDINNSSAVLSKTYYIEIAETTYNQLGYVYNHLVVSWGRKTEMDTLANICKYDSVIGDPSFIYDDNSFYSSGLYSSQNHGDVRYNIRLYSEFSDYATFPYVGYRVQQSDIIDASSQNFGVGYGASVGFWLPVTVTWAESPNSSGDNLFDIGIMLTYQYSTSGVFGSTDTRINSYYTDSTIVSTVKSRISNASNYSQSVAGAYEKALGIYRSGETDINFSYLRPVSGHFNIAEQAQGTVRIPSVYVPDDNYVKNQILQFSYLNGDGLSGFNVEYNPNSNYCITGSNFGTNLDLLGRRVRRMATAIGYHYDITSPAVISDSVSCNIVYSDYTYDKFYIQIENFKDPNEVIDDYNENNLLIDVYYTSYAENNGRLYLYYDYDQIISLIGTTLHWSVESDYFDLVVSGSYDSSVVSVDDYIVNNVVKGKVVSFPYSSLGSNNSQNFLFGLEITGIALMTPPEKFDFTIFYGVLDSNLNLSYEPLSVGLWFSNQIGNLKSSILDRNGTWASYIYDSLQPLVLGGIELMRPVNLGYFDYNNLEEIATATVIYEYNTSVLVIDNNLNSNKWVVQLSDVVSEFSLLDLGVKSKIPAGYRIGSIVEMDTGLRVRENCAENPLNTTFYRVDSIRTEPYTMSVNLTDKWPVTINYLVQWKTSPFAVMNEFNGNIRVEDYPSDANGDLVLSASDVSNILDRNIVVLQFLKITVGIDKVNVSYDSANDKYIVDLVYTYMSMSVRDYSTTAEEIKIALTPFSMWCDFYGKNWSLMFLNNEEHRYFSSVDMANLSPERVYGFFSYLVFEREIHDFSNWIAKYTNEGVSGVYNVKEVKGSAFYKFLNDTAGVFALTGGTVGLMFGHPIVGTAVGTLTWYSLATLSEVVNNDNGIYYTYFFFLDGTTDIPWASDTGADSRDDTDTALENRLQDLIGGLSDTLAPLSTFVKVILGLVALAIVVFLGIWAFNLIFGQIHKGRRKKK